MYSLNHAEVSLVLLIIWGIVYFSFRKKFITSRVFFLLLLFMGLAGILLPLNELLNIDTNNNFKIELITLFALLNIGSIIPWVKFDKYFSRVNTIRFNPAAEGYIQIIIITLILMGLYAIIYTLPYAVIGYRIGGEDVRKMIIMGDSILPRSFMTTIAVGVGFLSPIYILFFFLSINSERLRKYAFLLFVTSLAYLVTSAASQARDGFIMLPFTYFVFFQIFKNSLSISSIRKVKRLFKLMVPVLLYFLFIITFSRFYNADKNESWKGIISGTWGYLYQQPYVFDQTVQNQVYFHGVAYRFPLIGDILGLIPAERHIDFRFEYMFGTMYASFYSAAGWKSLFFASLFFYISWTIVLGLLNQHRNYFGMLIVFSLYLYFLISGLFYLRLSATSITITYLLLILSSFFLKRFAIVEYKE